MAQLARRSILLAAHGERRESATNSGVANLAAKLRGCNLAREVTLGFVNGMPSIGEGVGALVAEDIVVYPLFLSDGYFARVRLPALLERANGGSRKRRIHILPPLGSDPRLADLVEARLVAVARMSGSAPSQIDIVLLGHGSTKDAASRTSAERLAENVRQRWIFRAVRVALLEEAPSLRDATSGLPGPIIVLGLFAGDGMHGAGDAPRLIAELGRPDVTFAGTIAGLEGLACLVSAAVAQVTCGGLEVGTVMRSYSNAELSNPTQRLKPLLALTDTAR